MYYVKRNASGSSRLAGASIAVLIVALVGAAAVMATPKYLEGAAQAVSTVLTLTPEPELKKPEPQPRIEPQQDPEPLKLVAPEPDPILPPIETAPVIEFTPTANPVISESTPQPSAGIPSTFPSLRRASEPPYPSASIRADEEGVTTLQLCISTAGQVTSAKVISGSGYSRLDDAALNWIRKERFRPATVNGQPAATCNHTLSYEWKLQGR